MPLSPAFTASQDPSNAAYVVLVDTSTGSDSNIVNRRVYITNSAGNYLVPSGTTTNYVVWVYSDDSIALNILQEDTAVSIKVDWLDSGNNILYTLTQQFCLDMYSKLFFYQLVQMQGVTPSIPQDTNYSSNMAIFWTNVQGAEQAVILAQDLAGSQNLLNQCTQMRQQQQLYF